MHGTAQFDPIIGDHDRPGAVGSNSDNLNLSDFFSVNEKFLTVATCDYSGVIKDLEFVPGLKARQIPG
jgi:hypothetical protein